MHRVIALVSVFLGAAAVTVSAQDVPSNRKARVHRAEAGRPLPTTAKASRAERVADFLRNQGASAETARSLQALSEAAGRAGVVHLRAEQQVAGLRVHDAYVKAAFNARGELMHVIDGLAPVAGSIGKARVTEAQALKAALAALHPGVRSDLVEVSRSGNVVGYAKSSFFHASPRVERVAIPMAGGAMKTGYLVETWSEAKNQLHETLVGGDGRILEVVSRTNTDSYNVFTNSPEKTPQSVEPGSPDPSRPWLFAGDHTSQDIAGNNVHAYLDAVPDGDPDGGGTTVSDGNFLTAADLTESPATEVNRNVAVQNLFYLNNILHDDLYSHGFTEATGNFQEDNFGLGEPRTASDSVNGEVQDGGGLDNANFATPRDGTNPRMQMYLWTGVGDYQVVVNSPFVDTLRAQGTTAFGGALDTTGLTRNVTYVGDGCNPISTDLANQIALADRGTCNFTVKVKNAQLAGADSAIIANNVGEDGIFAMGGADATITIAAVMVSKDDGTTLKANLAGLNATVRRAATTPLQRDGDVDSDIVYHEYGHGLTWRMIGRMQGAMSGAVGEGMSDVLAVIYNEDDRVAEYSVSDSFGLRSAPYTNFPRTYSSVQATEVHFDGEVYGAIGWRMFELFRDNAIPKSILLDYIVDGMNYTPAAPTFEEMRDGILASVANTGGPDAAAHACLVWTAFAQYGVGEGALGRRTAVVESFTIPAGVCP
ncbi:MAG TPA: M36 family metallopeptidase [Vicinamibacteria bacterium]|nr:M36 family metallopeptidase [Vicinamibacteria bacterium]